MKIADFDAKVKIGSWILFKGKAYKVEDICRREHAVVIQKYKKVRCSEITYLGNYSGNNLKG